MLAYYEILNRLYSMKKSIIAHNSTARDIARTIQDLIDEMEVGGRKYKINTTYFPYSNCDSDDET